MTIIRKGVEKIGSYSMKKVFQKTLDDSSDGEQCIAMLLIAPYTHIGYIHSLKWEIVGASEEDPESFTECALRGSMVELPTGTTLADDWDAHMNYWMNTDPDEFTSVGTPTDVGITGEEHVAANQHEFFRREYTLGLPTYAYPTNASKIRYRASGSYKGHARTGNQLDIARGKLFGVGALSSVPGVESDKSDSATGGYGQQALYEALLDNLPASSEKSSPSQGDALASGVEKYLYDGVAHDVLSQTDALHIRMYLSARLDIYQPTSSRYISAP